MSKFFNSVMTEYMVPRSPEVLARLHNFYGALGWEVRHDTQEDTFLYVQPVADRLPVAGYYLTDNPRKVQRFIDNPGEIPSSYARGLRLPQLEDLVEVCLVVGDDDEVTNLWEQGGTLLEAHAHIPLRPHAGAQEFRFSDPFNYSLRVTSDPGYQLQG